MTLRPTWTTERIPGQPGLTSKTLSKTEEENAERARRGGGMEWSVGSCFPVAKAVCRGQGLARMPHPDGMTGRRWDSSGVPTIKAESEMILGQIAHESLGHRLQTSLGSTVRPCLREGENT